MRRRRDRFSSETEELRNVQLVKANWIGIISIKIIFRIFFQINYFMTANFIVIECIGRDSEKEEMCSEDIAKFQIDRSFVRR